MSVCVCMCVHDCMCTWVSAFALVTREQWKLLLSCGSVLELKLRSSGLAASAFTFWAILPARSWVLNVTLLMKPQFFKVSEKKKILFFWEGCQEIDPVQDTGWTSALQPATEDSDCLECSEYYFAATRQTFAFDLSHTCPPLKSQSDEVRLSFNTMHMYANEIAELILCIQPYARVHWNEKQSDFT